MRQKSQLKPKPWLRPFVNTGPDDCVITSSPDTNFIKPIAPDNVAIIFMSTGVPVCMYVNLFYILYLNMDIFKSRIIQNGE